MYIHLVVSGLPDIRFESLDMHIYNDVIAPQEFLISLMYQLQTSTCVGVVILVLKSGNWDFYKMLGTTLLIKMQFFRSITVDRALPGNSQKWNRIVAQTNFIIHDYGKICSYWIFNPFFSLIKPPVWKYYYCIEHVF